MAGEKRFHADMTVGENRARAVALRTMTSRMGFIAGPAIGALVAGVWSLPAVFMFVAVTKAMLLAIVGVLIAETRPVQEGPADGSGRPSHTPGRLPMETFLSRSFLVIAVTTFAISMMQQGVFSSLFPVYLRSIWNTIAISSVCGLAGTLLIAMIALVANRSEFPFRRQLEYVAVSPRAIPGLIAGVGIFYAMSLFPPLGWLRNTIWLLVIAYVMRYMPTGFGAIAPALAQIGAELDRSARTVGADWWRTSRSILLRLLAPAMFSCFALLFVLSLKEYVTAVFLFAPGSEVIGTTMLQFWINGDNGPVSALATIQIGITVVFVYAARKVLGVRIYG
jgi:ABC-type Fe3+ transport system permease subunit